MDLVFLGIEMVITFLIGILMVKFLTVHPLKIDFYLSMLWGSILVFISLILLLPFSNLYLGLVSLVLSGISFITGYYLMTIQVLKVSEDLVLPNINRNESDLGDGHIAVVYLTHGEPETYNPIGWLHQFKEFDELKTPFIPFIARPFFLYQLRKKYLKVGRSDHRRNHQLMIQDLEQDFRNSGDTNTQFYLSFLDDTPDPVTATINALNNGASHIILTEVFVSNSSHTLEGEKLVKEFNPAKYGATLSFTKPLWDSRALHQMFLAKLDEKVLESDKSKVGILLVGHGQPESWDKLFPLQTTQENSFREQIRDLLEKNGYSYENIGLTWMEFRNPRPAAKIKDFLDRGIEKIYYFAASISAEAIHSAYDIPDLIHASVLPKHVETVNLGAWNNHPLAIKAIKNRIDEVIKEIQ
ncbi:MAG: sirohydrochlorin chelatase [Candidatus Hodarchaeales archaeon]|jgi:protoheme ferro-lyase